MNTPSSLQYFSKCMLRALLCITAFILGLALACVATIVTVYSVISIKGNAMIDQLPDLPYGVDCIIVPGAQIYANRTPSPMLQDRLDGAIVLYKKGVSDRILVSGDHREDNYNEPLVMYKYLLSHGIPDQAIFMDHSGLDTYDTIYRAKHVFQVETAIIATQRFHLQRALFIADKTGIQSSGFATDPRFYASQLYMFVRETGARLKAVYETRTGALPAHISPPCPITGDGRTTRDPF
ncbi:MAG: DUF218 domain-containing protein [Clostridiaceae bacterium]|nr:DUF218 domain-containing protein [Clostridiaceae bacterium]